MSLGLMIRVAGPAVALSVSAASAAPIVFTLDGVESWDMEESPFNTLMDDPSVTAGTPILNVTWDLTLTTFGGSYASEATILVRDGQNNRLAFLYPAYGDDSGVSGATYQGSIDWALTGDEFVLGFDTLRLEFYEAFDDNFEAVDAVWSGTITFNVPGPGVLGGLPAVGLCGMLRRRRRV